MLRVRSGITTDKTAEVDKNSSAERGIIHPLKNKSGSENEFLNPHYEHSLLFLAYETKFLDFSEPGPF